MSLLRRPEPGKALRETLAGPAGALEYRLEAPREAPRGLALICHPHPLYGGTMDNKVVYTLARAALAQGWVALRFQFRGVGASEGEHDGGRGELRDTEFLLAELEALYPGLPAVLMGFSFGAYVALSCAARRQELAGLLTIAPPLSYAGDAAAPTPSCPWRVIHGDADEVVSCEDTRQRAEALERPPDWQTLAGAGHFFHGRLPELRSLTEDWLAQGQR